MISLNFHNYCDFNMFYSKNNLKPGVESSIIIVYCLNLATKGIVCL